MLTAPLGMLAHRVCSLTGASLSLGTRAAGLPDLNGECRELGAGLRIEVQRLLTLRDVGS